jgi:hypothetical protein
VPIDLSTLRHHGIFGTSVIDDDVAAVTVDAALEGHGPASHFDRAALLTLSLGSWREERGRRTSAALRVLDVEVEGAVRSTSPTLFAATVTFPFSSLRRYLFYVAQRDDTHEWRAFVEAALSRWEISTEVVEDPDWRIYGSYLAAARHGEEDLAIERILLEHNVDVRVPRRVRHRLDLPTTQAALEAAQDLGSEGFTVFEPTQGPDGRWTLEAEIVEVPMALSMARRRAWFSAFCDARDGEYDGWGTSIERRRRQRRVTDRHS